MALIIMFLAGKITIIEIIMFKILMSLLVIDSVEIEIILLQFSLLLKVFKNNIKKRINIRKFEWLCVRERERDLCIVHARRFKFILNKISLNFFMKIIR